MLSSVTKKYVIDKVLLYLLLKIENITLNSVRNIIISHCIKWVNTESECSKELGLWIGLYIDYIIWTAFSKFELNRYLKVVYLYNFKFSEKYQNCLYSIK